MCVYVCVCCLSTQKSGHLTIYRVERFLNTTVTLKSKKMSGCIPDSRQTVPFAASSALSYLTMVHCAIFSTVTTRIRHGPGIYASYVVCTVSTAIGHAHCLDTRALAVHSGLGYTASYTVPIAPSTKSAVLPGPSCEFCSTGMSLLETSSLVNVSILL